MTDEEINQALREIKERHERDLAWIDASWLGEDLRRHVDKYQLLKIVESLSDKLAEQEKEIKLLREYHKASEDLDTDPNNAYHALSLTRAALSSFDDMRAKEQCK